jgi:AcrR family transcriptional regulator
MAKGRSRHNSHSSAGSEATQARIVEATLATIRADGILGASARAIARTGNFNQASIYYHFGSINDAVLAAVQQMSRERLFRYEQRMMEVSSLAELVKVANELYAEDVSSGTIKVLSQVMAGAASDQSFAKDLAESFDPWIDTVSRALQRTLASSTLDGALPIDDLSYAVSALFVGVELLGQVHADDTRVDRLFGALGSLAQLVGSVLAAPPQGAVPPTSPPATPHPPAA